MDIKVPKQKRTLWLHIQAKSEYNKLRFFASTAKEAMNDIRYVAETALNERTQNFGCAAAASRSRKAATHTITCHATAGKLNGPMYKEFAETAREEGLKELPNSLKKRKSEYEHEMRYNKLARTSKTA